MPGKFDYSELVTESGNWNVAKHYSEIKIMKWLVLIDEYETIARFGTSDMLEEFNLDENFKNVARIKAIKRLHHAITKLIDNTIFALKKKDKEKFTDYKKDLKVIESVIPTIEFNTINQKAKTSAIVINEDRFIFVLETLIKINTKMLDPLNDASLIFTPVEEFDPMKIKEKIAEQLVNQG